MASTTAFVAPFRDPSRPPTPPKEKTMPLKLGQGPSTSISTRPRLPDTPDDSPSSSAEDFKATSNRSKKKVAWHQIVDDRPSLGGAPGSSPKGCRPLRPSRECRSTKSILKVAHENNGIRADLGLDGTNLQSTLRSTNEHLAANSRSSSLDAYNTLLACVSTYEDTSKPEDILAPMTELCRYIKRDILLRPTTETPGDLHLAPTAVKIATAFLGSPLLANTLPDEFKAFIVEQSIHKLEDGKTAQVLLSHYLCMLEKSRWGPKIMNADRTQRLLAGLDRLGPRGKNLRIVCHRLMIYKQLLVQAKSIMSSRVEIWLHHLFSGLLSSVKDVRARAIACGMEAGLQIGGVSNVSRCCLDVLNQKAPTGERIVDILHARAIAVLGSKEEATQIPQTWSILILLQRSRRSRLETWDHFQLWKDIISRCLDSADVQTKHQAHLAINRLMYSINIDVITPSMAAFLQQLLELQLRPPTTQASTEKKVVISKQSARSTYCVVLYYALHPAASHAQLDLCWDRMLADVLVPALLHTKADTSFACEVIASMLFNEGPPRVWEERKANSHGPVLASELPTLDPKWVRSRATKILNTLDTLSLRIDKCDQHLMEPIWKHLVAAVGSACSKEVRVSNDTLTFLSALLNQVQRQIVRAVDVDQRANEMKRLLHLIDDLSSKIGTLPLSEKRILLDEHGVFCVSSESQSNRSKHALTPNKSPAEFFLRLSLDAKVTDPSGDFSKLLQKVFSIIAPSSHSRANRIEGLKELTRLCKCEDSGSWDQAGQVFWQTIAEEIISILGEQRPSERQPLSIPPLAQEAKGIVKVLEMGLQSLGYDKFPSWKKLYNKLVESILHDLGSLAVSTLIVEPLSNQVRKQSGPQMDDWTLQYVQILLGSIYWPQSRQSYEQMLVRLSEPAKRSRLFPEAGLADDVYRLTENTLECTYSNSQSLSTKLVEEFLSVVDRLIRTCPTIFLSKLFSRLQQGLSVWIEDAAVLARSTDDGLLPRISQIWSLFAKFVQEATDSDTSLLVEISPLITAGLQSRHQCIVNEAVALWNQKFGSVTNLKYTGELEKALGRLKELTEIDAPGLSENLIPPDHILNQKFDDAQESEDNLDQSNLERTSLRLRGQRSLSVLPDAGRAVKVSPGEGSKHRVRNPREQGKNTPKARLRHDDSQIDFAAVDSSPLVYESAESQMLTDRQKEVLERQKQDAALFPDITTGDSSTPIQSPSRLPRFALKTQGVTRPILDIEEDNGLPFAAEDLIQGVVGSSPTPSSSRRRPEEQRLDEEIPSSPPLIATHQQVREVSVEEPATTATETCPTFDSFNNRSPRQESPSLLEASQQLVGRTAPRQPLPQNLGISNGYPDSRHSNSVDARSGSYPRSQADDHPHDNQLDQMAVDGSVDCRIEILESKDTTSESKHGPGSSYNQDETRSFPISAFEGQSTSRDLGGDEVEAQLLSEMQGASLSNATESQVLRIGGKRKRSVEASSRGRKRFASQTQRPSTEAGRAHDEVAADCVLIESRPTSGLFQSISPEKEVTIKLEHPESPAGVGASTEPAALSTRSRTRQHRDTNTQPGPVTRGRRRGRPSEHPVQIKDEPTEYDNGIQFRHIPQARRGGGTALGSQSSSGLSEAVDGKAHDRAGLSSGRHGRRKSFQPSKQGIGDSSRERSYLEEVRRILGRREQMHLSSNGEGELREMLLQVSFESQKAANERAGL